MKVKRPLPSQSHLREVLNYDALAGDFTWRPHRFQTKQSAGKWVGKSAGSLFNGYIFIKVPLFHQVGAHRLAWIYIHGDIPDGMEVDHKDRNGLNNSIENLRLATAVENARNCGPRRHNKLGVKGVTLTRSGSFYARVKVDGREINLGHHATLEEAATARRAGEQKYYGEFA